MMMKSLTAVIEFCLEIVVEESCLMAKAVGRMSDRETFHPTCRQWLTKDLENKREPRRHSNECRNSI